MILFEQKSSWAKEAVSAIKHSAETKEASFQGAELSPS